MYVLLSLVVSSVTQCVSYSHFNKMKITMRIVVLSLTSLGFWFLVFSFKMFLLSFFLDLNPQFPVLLGGFSINILNIFVMLAIIFLISLIFCPYSRKIQNKTELLWCQSPLCCFCCYIIVVFIIAQDYHNQSSKYKLK